MTNNAKDILEKHCPSMNDLYLDEQGKNFRNRILNAMIEYCEINSKKEKKNTCFDLYHNIPNAEKSICPICKQWTK